MSAPSSSSALVRRPPVRRRVRRPDRCSSLSWLLLLLPPLLLLSGFAPGPARAAGSVHVGLIGPADGLPAGKIEALLRDRQGQLWIGTAGGLLRLSSAGLRSAEALGLPVGPGVRALAEQPPGTLWIGTGRGLLRLAAGRLTLLGPAQGLPAPEITALAAAPQGLWVGTTGGLALVEGESTPVVRSLARAGSLLGDEIVALAPAPGQGLWLASVRSGLGLLQGDSLREWPLPPSPAGGGRVTVSSLAVDEEGALWLGHATGLLRQLPGQPFRPLPAPEAAGAAVGHGGGPAGQAVHQLVVAPGGRLLVATGDGLWLRERGRFELLGVEQGLPQPAVHAALLDDQGTLWLAQPPAGLARLPQLGVRFLRQRELGPHTAVGPVVELVPGVLLLGTAQGLLRWEERAGVTRRWQEREGLPSRQVEALLQTGSGLLVGTAEGLVRLEARRGGELVRAPLDPRLPARGIRQLLAAGDGEVWAASEVGVLRLRGTRLVAQEGLAAGLPDERIEALLPAGEARPALAATAGGLARRDEASGRWQSWSPGIGPEGRPLPRVRCLLRDRRGQLWLGSAEGLFLVAPGGSLASVAPFAEALPSQAVSSLGEDASGRLWIGTTRGLAVWDGRLLVSLAGRLGLPVEEASANGFSVAGDGTLLLGSLGGLSTVEPSLLATELPAPRAQIAAVQVGDGVWGLPGARLLLVPEVHSFGVRLDSSELLEPGRVRYSVQLEGRDPGWSPPSAAQPEPWRDLPQGRYRLRVRATLDGVRYGESEPGLEIEVRTSWLYSQEARWATRGGVGLLVLLLLWAVWVRHQRRLAQRLERQVLERTFEIAEKNQQLQELSLRDPLTRLHNRRFFQETVPTFVADGVRAQRGLQRGGPAPCNADIGLLLVDIDHFKQVNDTYGHDAGDVVLVDIARVLEQAVRESDLVVRWGGEEFLVVARQTDRRFLGTLAERILGRVRDHVFVLPDGRTLHRTCSLGFTIVPLPQVGVAERDWERIVAIADQALYLAKRSGRDLAVGVVPGHRPAPGTHDLPAVEQGVAEGVFRLVASRAGALAGVEELSAASLSSATPAPPA